MKDPKKKTKKNKTGENLSAPGFCQNFLDILNAYSIKEKNEKLDLIKIETFSCVKDRE